MLTVRSSSSHGLADSAIAAQLIGSVTALQQQAQGFQVREAEKMAEQREAMRAFEMQQEARLQGQMQQMMVQMWSYMDPATLAALTQTSVQVPGAPAVVQGEPVMDEFPDNDVSWEEALTAMEMDAAPQS